MQKQQAKPVPRGHAAVMNQRTSPVDALDFFCTPPWATRALFKLTGHLNPNGYRSAWDPAAGEGHMSEVLKEYFSLTYASDIHDYGQGYQVGDFMGPWKASNSGWQPTVAPDFIICNPPFNQALDFVCRGLLLARCGVCILARSNWAEGQGRYHHLFGSTPPTMVGQFAERVPMKKGEWDPNYSTATAYSWFVWLKPEPFDETTMHWIPPCREELTKPDDVERFAYGARRKKAD